MKKKRFGEYQIRTRDLDAICFHSYSLSDCKEWCRNGNVVVSTYKKKIGISITFTFSAIKGRFFRYSKFGRDLTLFWFVYIRWENIYKDKVDEVVYDSLFVEREK